MRALVTGATGFIGRALVARLDRPVVLTRNAEAARQSLAAFQPDVFAWDAEHPPPLVAFEGIDVVFHLAGEPVAEGRWTAEKKQKIRESRLLGTRHLVRAIRALAKPPATLVSASAVGFYGSRGDEFLDENSRPSDDFLAQVCQAWEAESQPAREAGVRVVNPRLGLVLGHGGALAKMLPPFRLGLGGRLGSGRQWVPWIHLEDVVGILLHAAGHHGIAGPVNVVGPQPVTNAEFARALAAVLHRPAVFPVPAFGLRLLFGELADVLLASQRALPTVAEQTGYAFKYRSVEAALQASIAPPQPNSARSAATSALT